MTQLAVSGASGKTGWRVVEEALKRGRSVRAIVRPGSVLPSALAQAEKEGRLEVSRLELDSAEALLHALQGCTALVIATGARPSINLAGPLQVDAWGVQAAGAGLPLSGAEARGAGQLPLRWPLAASPQSVRPDPGLEAGWGSAAWSAAVLIGP